MLRRGQKVLSYVIFHRHGQRAPTKNIYEASHTTPHHAPHRPLAEAETWQGLLAATEELDALQKLYPVRRHPKRELQSDLNTKPFGCLTATGLDHLEQKGRATRKAFPALSRVPEGGFRVYATNYQRTQASAQAFLKGLGAPAGTCVEVLASEHCPLSFYDHDPALAVKLTKQVQNTATFRKEESNFVDTHGHHLIRVLPELATTRDVFTFNIPINDSATETETERRGVGTEQSKKEEGKGNRINWMAALDYFSCRSAHQLPIHPQVEAEHFGASMKEYVGSRFSLYYADQEMRRLAVRPMLSGVVLKEFNAQLARLKEAALPPSAVIYSGHDVNLLGLLVTLNSSVVRAKGGGIGQSRGGHWPDYGSSLVFELVQQAQVDTTGAGGAGVRLGRDSEFLVNVYYNQQPLSFQLPSIGSADTDSAAEGGGDSAGTAEVGASNTIRLTDLIAFCDQL